MIEATQEGKYVFLVKLDIPDATAIQEIAMGYGMKITDVLVSCINNGITHHTDILREIKAHNNRKQ